MKEYDYLIVGAGLYGAVMAHELKKKGKKCLVIDRRDHIAGNIYCEDIEGIHVHKYGAHIFHTSDKKIWDYMNQFAEFNNYINSQRNSGEESVQNFRHLLSNVCHSDLFTIITISMTDIREFRLAVIQQSLRRCWKGQKFAQGLISLNSEKRIRRLQRRLFLQE